MSEARGVGSSGVGNGGSDGGKGGDDSAPSLVELWPGMSKWRFSPSDYIQGGVFVSTGNNGCASGSLHSTRVKGFQEKTGMFCYIYMLPGS
ncbi:MAG: hypothetical protein PHU78_01350 [Heliobacteriaceae bacterium]|nr:hypothetical protein [Heliobacteriaceae bacterium]